MPFVYPSCALKHDDEKHFEFFFAVNRVRVLCGHQNAFALVHEMRLAVDRDLPDAVKARNQSVAVRLVRTDFFALIESKRRYAYRAVLRKRFAYDLPVTIFDLLFQSQKLCFIDVFHFIFSPFRIF